MALICGGKKIFMLGEPGLGKTVTMSAIEFLAQGLIAKEQLSGYNITSHHWENEHGNYLDEHGCPIHIQNDLLMKNTTFYPFKKHPVINIDIEEVIQRRFNDTIQIFFEILQTKANKYNVGHLYKPEKRLDSVKTDFIQLILLLTNLGQGYERRVIILLDNVDYLSPEHVNKSGIVTDAYSIKKFAKSFYKAIRNCSNDIHTVLAFGGFKYDVNIFFAKVWSFIRRNRDPII